VLNQELFDLYSRYIRQWHSRDDPESPDGLEAFLYRSPVNTFEFLYRDPAGKLIGVGICDVSRQSLSSVYFYHDPESSDRSLGTFAVLYEIEEARQAGIPHYYLGYWVDGCRTMQYKANFRPHEVLHPDGAWHRGAD